MNEYETYIDTIDVIENRVIHDTKYPVITDNRVKRCCKHTLEPIKFVLNFLKYKIDAEKETNPIKKQQIPENFELSDEEPAVVNLNEEQKLSSKFITFDCPICKGKLQLRNEIEINPKGVKCSCNPCSFKLTKNDKTMNVSRDDNGDIKLDSEDHSISFSWNRQITPEDKKVESTNKMISDVMSTPRSSGRKSMNDMD